MEVFSSGTWRGPMDGTHEWPGGLPRLGERTFMSQHPSNRVVASTEGLSSESHGESPSARVGWAISSAAAFTVAACVMTGLFPVSWILPSMVGSVLLIAWCTGILAFACAIGADQAPVRLAIRHHQVQERERRANLRNAA